ncbi:MAG TPA: L-histidine N(alpha)-methyltransferase [Terriglobia bacterium]|nr:L-histidine N(alpha)-methyltransferase [Terriglobia bacterium]
MLAHEITLDPVAQFAREVRDGLSKPGQKELPSKYLYDAVGSALFEVISLLPEYGLTRADERILRRHADDITSHISSPAVVAELGSGSGKKTRWILEALARRQPTTYHPIEISPAALAQVERELDHLPRVAILGFEAEYLDGLRRAAAVRRPGERILVLFLGSSIGNFDREPGEQFLQKVRETLTPGDALLLGTDLEKSVPRLLLAYADSLGVTAAFNLNLLARINRELGGNFDLAQFEHLALFNSNQRRIEMHLRSKADQHVAIHQAGFEVALRQGETIWTESSHKYRADEPYEMAERSGFRCDGQWIDTEWPFAESFLTAVSRWPAFYEPRRSRSMVRSSLKRVDPW